MNNRSDDGAESVPIRYVMPVVEAGERWGWRVVVSAKDADHIRVLAKCNPITSERNLSAILTKHAPLWPAFPPEYFVELLDVLNVLHVTRSETIAQRRSSHNETAPRIARVKDAIATLEIDLPKMLAKAGYRGFSQDQVLRLAVLTEASAAARDIIVLPKPAHREIPWHETAKLLNWYLESILDSVGYPKQAIHSNDTKVSPMASIILELLAMAEGLHLTEQALRKRLLRSDKDTVAILSLEEINSMGYSVIA
jgi:hypothetical protein